jgi:glycosyltransferase involved in cell wall biosynthesis
MRILYDGYVYREQPTGGINRYFANLIKRLPGDVVPLLTTPGDHTLDYPAHANLKTFRFKGVRPLRVSFRMEKYYFRCLEAAVNFDVAHPTYYSLLTQRDFAAYRRPIVLTVWDMTHERFTNHFRDGAQVVEMKRKAIEAAHSIICISESTKKDLLEYYPHVTEGRVRVTHLASELDESMGYGPEMIPLRPYFLFVGARGGYKNFSNLLAAFARVANGRQDLTLCVVGTPFSAAEQRDITEMRLSGRVEHYGRASDAQLAKLYRHSIALVYPSLYEGFGIPLVEAMACGTAVVASNRASLPEVLGAAGLLFDPAVDDLADILLSLVENPSERERLVALGRKRAQDFSWDRTAAQTIDVYHSVRD